MQEGLFPSESIKIERPEKWRCKECHFDNYHLLNACEICESVRPGLDAPIQKGPQDAVICCRNKQCKAKNTLDVEYCIKCGHPLFEQKPLFSGSEKIRINKDLIKCPLCSLENHKSNKICLNCNNLLIPQPKTVFSHSLFSGIKICEQCGSSLRSIRRRFGGIEYEACDCELKEVVASGTCSFCDKKVSSIEWKIHQEQCQKKKQFYNKENPTFDRCSDLQITTILHMHTKSYKKHYANQKALLTRIRKIGFTEEDLDNLHYYITHYAPIIVHMRASNFVYYAKDTHYRNAFQIHKGMGGGGGRVDWEDRMFDRMHHDATPFQRVKYGTMNFTNDPKGVAVCQGYGLSYFLLKPHLRDRCTITDMDSASPATTIGTFRFINHILIKLSDNQLKSAFQGSRGKEMLSNVIGIYKEIQIHGPLEFSKDISRVYICKQEIVDKKTKSLIEEFCDKNKLEWEEFEPRNKGPRYDLYGAAGAVHSSVAPSRFIGESKIKKQQIEKEEQQSIFKKPASRKRKKR